MANEKKKVKTQQDMVLAHLKCYHKITSATAWEKYGITRLADCIYDLRGAGYLIETEDTRAKNRYGRIVRFATYRLRA